MAAISSTVRVMIVFFGVFAAMIFSVTATSAVEDVNKDDVMRILREVCSPGDEKLIIKLVTRLVKAEAELKRLKSMCEETLTSVFSVTPAYANVH